MKFPGDKQLRTLDGVAFKIGDEEKPLKTFCVEALLSVQNVNESGEQKMKCFLLAKKIHEGASELTVDEVSLVKQYVGKAYPALYVGTIFEALEKGE